MTSTETSAVTIDTAIAAWKGATTEADRAMAEEAIEQHIAHETPEDGDYEYATRELIDRLKAECGPVPTPEDGVYEDEACTVAIEDEATLPSIFYHLSGEDLTRYWYQGQHRYDRHERRASEDGEAFWYGLGSVTIDDDATAEDFLGDAA